MPKKIICTVTNDLTYDQRMQRICTSLQKNKFDVQLIGRAVSTSKPLSNMVFSQYRLNCFFNKGVLFYAEFNLRLLLFLLFTSFDIVCGCDLDTLPAAFVAAKLKRKKVVYDAHEYFPESPELIGKPFKQSVWLLIEKWIVPNVDAVYTVTNSIAQLFNKKYNVNAKLVRNFPFKNNPKSYEQKAAKNIEASTPILLYQGAVNVGRGINEMLLAMLKIDNAVFYIAGDGDEYNAIQSNIQQLQLENKVKLLGKKTPEALKLITKQAYIGINLLENRGLSYYYSLGNKTFDYIQAGIPQVLIGFPEYIALNQQYEIGIVVKELTIEHVIQAIQQLLQNKELYKRLQNNCQKVRNELCWEKEEKYLLEIYNRLK